jgi:hypothetical protein
MPDEAHLALLDRACHTPDGVVDRHVYVDTVVIFWAT